ncbi:hypothetical protein G6F63_016858 [Rhizopus arrhizus]|nr:hypothetical protein G6F63_016858 [Rhizopus arrhizus]
MRPRPTPRPFPPTGGSSTTTRCWTGWYKMRSPRIPTCAWRSLGSPARAPNFAKRPPIGCPALRSPQA